MAVHPNSLENLSPKKYQGRRVGLRLSGPARKTLGEMGRAHAQTRTWAVEAVPEMILTLRACAEVIDPDSALGKRLASLKVEELGDAIACLEVLGDDDGDCILCGSSGYDWRSSVDNDCLACKGKGSFLLNKQQEEATSITRR